MKPNIATHLFSAILAVALFGAMAGCTDVALTDGGKDITESSDSFSKLRNAHLMDRAVAVTDVNGKR